MTDIFIRTYKNDLEWLKYCLKSINKFVTGYHKIIVCIPEDQVELLNDFNLENIIACPVYKNDYIGQQISKLLSYKNTDAEFILFIDSDTHFNKPVNISEYFKLEKPIVFETPWKFVGDAVCWRDSTERILKISIETEKMRRLPIVYRASTLKAIDEIFNCESFSNFDKLSEFNVMGSYAHEYERDNYYFWDTIENPNLPESKSTQEWSWGGLDDSKRARIEKILE